MATTNPSSDFTREWMPLLKRPSTPAEAQRLYNHIRTIAFYLDALTAVVPGFQGSPIQIGVEPIIAAFLPVVGPFFGLVAGLYVIALCCLFGIGIDLIGRMLINLFADVFAGYVPILGTVIDVAFKCNLANLAILEGHLKKSRWAMITIPPPRRWFDWSSLGRQNHGGRASTMSGF